MIRTNNFLAHCFQLVKVYVTGLILLLLIRLFFLSRLMGASEIFSLKGDIFHAFIVGFRFDTMVLMYALAVPLSLCLIGLGVTSPHFHTFISKFNRSFSIFALLLLALIGIVDVFYYNYFQSHINVLMFGLFEDDTSAVLASVWTDYPVMRVLLSLLLIYFLLRYFISKIYQSTKKIETKKPFTGILAILVVLLLFVTGMRGSLGTFPLQIDDSTVCDNSSVNLLPLNGAFAVKEAFVMRNKQMDLQGNMKFLKELGYGNDKDAIEDYFGRENVNAEDIYKNYFATTTSSSKNKLPHVVFFLMESMSNNNLYYHSSQLNLYGALEKHLSTDIFLRNIFPAGNGTINSLEGIMVNTPVTSLAQSKYVNTTFESSVAKPFLNAGYNTTFITGGKLGWRNINLFIPKQYFEKTESKDNVLKEIPGSSECEWGVYDEYLFDYVLKKLEHATKPQMIFVLTTTNHTPFHLPANYKPYPVNISPELKSKLLTDETLAKKNLTNLQYSNDCLGKFMDKIKASSLADETIVAATGDHNNLMLVDFKEEQMYQQRSVPIYMYVPSAYMQGFKSDSARWGSHKDIFPTLINLSLPEAQYFNSGQNLLDTTVSSLKSFGTDWMSTQAINSYGAVSFGNPSVFYQWKKDKKELGRISTPSPELSELMKQAKAHYASMAYYIKHEVDKK